MEHLTEEQFLALTNEEKMKEYEQAYRQQEIYWRWYSEEKEAKEAAMQQAEEAKAEASHLKEYVKRYANCTEIDEVQAVSKELLNELIGD